MLCSVVGGASVLPSSRPTMEALGSSETLPHYQLLDVILQKSRILMMTAVRILSNAMK
jgi:hypothetical protein